MYVASVYYITGPPLLSLISHSSTKAVSASLSRRGEIHDQRSDLQRSQFRRSVLSLLQDQNCRGYRHVPIWSRRRKSLLVFTAQAASYELTCITSRMMDHSTTTALPSFATSTRTSSDPPNEEFIWVEKIGSKLDRSTLPFFDKDERGLLRSRSGRSMGMVNT
jgi:hypothetical protein